MDGRDRPEEKQKLSPPGLGSDVPGVVVINGHTFKFKRRTFGDVARIRAYALNLLVLHTTPEMAAEMVTRRALEYKVAELGVCLVEAPEHWKVFSEIHGQKIIAPEVLDFDEYIDEFMEVYQEYTRFLNTFRLRRPE